MGWVSASGCVPAKEYGRVLASSGSGSTGEEFFDVAMAPANQRDVAIEYGPCSGEVKAADGPLSPAARRLHR
jgi:hypothetical protein